MKSDNMSEEVIHSTTPKEGDFNLKDLVFRVIDYVKLLWKHKIWIILCALLGSGIAYYLAKQTPIKYNAGLTFTLNEGGDGTNMNAVSGLLGQFGIGGMSTGKVSLDKIVELSKSMRILRSAIFMKAKVDGNEDFLANHILKHTDLIKEWSKYDPSFKEFRFRTDSFENFTLNENSALKGIYSEIVGGINPGLVQCIYTVESTIFSLFATTKNEQLSLALVNCIYTTLSRFYIQQSVDKQKQTYDLVKRKTDSLYRDWVSTEYTISDIDQREGAIWAPVERTKKTMLIKKSMLMAGAVGEALRNLEMADYALKNNTPFIREIDTPFLPLDIIAPNIRLQFLIGLFIGGAVSVIIILIIHLLKSLLKF